ncbi:MAG TPA: hypothetical protein VGQ20_12065 [Acidimicrobiales bacterium]|jgi:quinol monooxygenase YgiN|nr:hypothetical protein [Acidimicrobiales bacterium]
MVRLVAIYPVRDFDDFMREMSKNADARAARGITLHSIHRSVDDPNEVMVTVEFASREAAEVVLQAEDALRAWMDRAGVDFYPAVFVGERVD